MRRGMLLLVVSVAAADVAVAAAGSPGKETAPETPTPDGVSAAAVPPVEKPDTNPAVAPSRRAKSKRHGAWLVGLGGGTQTMLADAVLWLGGATQSELSFWASYGLGAVAPAVRGLRLRVGYSRRVSPGSGLRLARDGARLGVVYQLPANGFFDALFPYVRASLLADWVRFQLLDAPPSHNFVPGIGGSAGLRVALPRMAGRARFFLAAEGGYEYYPGVEFAVDVQDAESVASAPTPLGRVSLSGIRWGLTAGIQF